MISPVEAREQDFAGLKLAGMARIRRFGFGTHLPVDEFDRAAALVQSGRLDVFRGLWRPHRSVAGRPDEYRHRRRQYLLPDAAVHSSRLFQGIDDQP